MPVTILPEPTPTFGSELSRTITDYSRASLNQRLQEMQDQKHLDQIKQYNEQVNEQVFGNKYGGAQPEVALGLHKLMVEHGGRQRLSSFEDAILGSTPSGLEQIPEKIDFSESGEPNIPVEKPMNEVEQLKARQKKAVDLYNQETDPTIKKQMFQAIQANEKAIRDTKKDIREETKLKRELETEPRKFIQSLDNTHNLNRNRKIILNTMKENAPKLPKNVNIKKFLSDRLGIPLSLLAGPESEVIDKLSAQLIQGVSVSYDQARILQTEVEQYIRANPSLLNSPEGMKKIADIGLTFLNLEDNIWNYKNNLVKSYRKRGDILPEDLETQITEKSDEYVNKALKEIKKITSSASTKEMNSQKEQEEMISVITPDGRRGKLPKSREQEAIKQGWKIQ